MGRLPYHIHVFPFRHGEEGLEFALFQRADLPTVWQGISGGGESGESIQQTALRECAEEGGIAQPGPLYPLDSISSMPSEVFPKWQKVWGPNVLVLPMYFLAMAYEGDIALSDEHLTCGWFPFEKGYEKMKVPDQRSALWELNHRLVFGRLQRPLPGYFTRPWGGWPMWEMAK